MSNTFLINTTSFDLLKSNKTDVNNILNILPQSFIPSAKSIYRIILALCSGWFEQQNFTFFEQI